MKQCRRQTQSGYDLTKDGVTAFEGLGIDLDALTVTDAGRREMLSRFGIPSSILRPVSPVDRTSMYQPKHFSKKDQVRFWCAPDRVFFASGACHILAHAFLERFTDRGFRPVWIRPAPGFWGNHVLVTNGEISFDYHGYSRYPQLLDHFARRARRIYPGWDASVVPVTVSLVNHEQAKTIGLYIREPKQFLHDALPRARRFIDRFAHARLPDPWRAPGYQ